MKALENVLTTHSQNHKPKFKTKVKSKCEKSFQTAVSIILYDYDWQLTRTSLSLHTWLDLLSQLFNFYTEKQLLADTTADC